MNFLLFIIYIQSYFSHPFKDRILSVAAKVPANVMARGPAAEVPVTETTYYCAATSSGTINTEAEA